MHVGISFQSYTNGLSRTCFFLGLPEFKAMVGFNILGLLCMGFIYFLWDNDLVWDNCCMTEQIFFFTWNNYIIPGLCPETFMLEG